MTVESIKYFSSKLICSLSLSIVGIWVFLSIALSTWQEKKITKNLVKVKKIGPAKNSRKS